MYVYARRMISQVGRFYRRYLGRVIAICKPFTSYRLRDVNSLRKYSSVRCPLSGNFFQRDCYIFQSQIDKVCLYVFQRRFKIFLEQKQVKISGAAYSQT